MKRSIIKKLTAAVLSLVIAASCVPSGLGAQNDTSFCAVYAAGEQANAVQVSTWAELQETIDSVRSGSCTIKLLNDMKADAEFDDALTVPDKVQITLDLNGHRLDRAMETADKNGHVIIVKAGGELTVTDSAGLKRSRITGGNAFNGGGIVNSGTLNLLGGYITGNKAGTDDKQQGLGGGVLNYGTLNIDGGNIESNLSVKGSGIYNTADGKVTVTNARICSNRSYYSGGGIFNKGTVTFVKGSKLTAVSGNESNYGSGAGIYASEGRISLEGVNITSNKTYSVGKKGAGIFKNKNAVLSLTGDSIKVLTNKDNIGEASNLYMYPADKINVQSAIGSSSIGITLDMDDEEFTQGLAGNGTAANFKADKLSFAVSARSNGEAAVAKTVSGENTLVGTSLSLNGDIGVNIYIKPSLRFINEGGYAEIQGPNITGSKKVYFTDDNKTENGFRISCSAYSAQMNKPVTVRLVKDEGGAQKTQTMYINGKGTAIGAYSTTVCKYLEQVQASQTASKKLRDLAKAIYNYGAYAQKYFGDPKVPDMTADAEAIKNITANTLVNYAVTFSDAGGKPAGFSYQGVSLILKETTTLNIYFKMTGGQKAPAVTLDGKKLDVKQSGDSMYVTIPNIKSTDLSTTYNVFFGGFLIRISPMSYAYNALIKRPDLTNLCNVCKALYVYSVRAKSYFG